MCRTVRSASTPTSSRWSSRGRAVTGQFLPLIEGRVLAVSFAVVAELRAGAIKAGWGPRRRERQERSLRQHYVVLTATDRVVTRFAELYATLGEDRLKRGGVNDQWTAA